VEAIIRRARRWLPPLSGISFVGVLEVFHISKIAFSSWQSLAVVSSLAAAVFVDRSLQEARARSERAVAQATCGVACAAVAAIVGIYKADSWTWLWIVAGVGAAVAVGQILAWCAEYLLPEGGKPAAFQLGPPPAADPWQNVPRL
jgi:hypothetical protein